MRTPIIGLSLCALAFVIWMVAATARRGDIYNLGDRPSQSAAAQE